MTAHEKAIECVQPVDKELPPQQETSTLSAVFMKCFRPKIDTTSKVKEDAEELLDPLMNKALFYGDESETEVDYRTDRRLRYSFTFERFMRALKESRPASSSEEYGWIEELFPSTFVKDS